MKILVVKDYNHMIDAAKNMIIEEIQLKDKFILGLATGSTFEGLYEKLIHSYNNGQVDFTQVKTFNLDEYYPMEKSHDQSYYQYMHKRLFNHVNVKAENIHMLNGSVKNPEEECNKYDSDIKSCGGIDLQLLGIGGNGHIGFNEPSEDFEIGTHLVDLDTKTITDNSRFFQDKTKVPKQALTVGIKTIMDAKKIILLATGKGKNAIIKELISQNITPKLPATILKLHRDCTFILDEAAAEGLDI